MPVLTAHMLEEVRDIYKTGLMGSQGIVDMFGEDTSEYQMHLAIMLCFSDFIEKRVPGVAALGTYPAEDQWVQVVKWNLWDEPVQQTDMYRKIVLIGSHFYINCMVCPGYYIHPPVSWILDYLTVVG